MADRVSSLHDADTLDTEFTRGLGLYDSTMVVVGSMIGSGIFIVSADMARLVGSPGWLLLAWVVTGVLTVTAALSYGELAAMMPRAGGQYVYLREAFSPLWGFLYGWTLFMVIQTGTIAAVAVAFARFLGAARPGISESQLPDSADPPVRPATRVSLSTAQFVGVADDRAPDVDQHAGPGVRQGHPERLHDREDGRGARADRGRPAWLGWNAGAVVGQLRRPVDAARTGRHRARPDGGHRVRALRRRSASPRPGRSSRPTRGTTSRSRPAR